MSGIHRYFDSVLCGERITTTTCCWVFSTGRLPALCGASIGGDVARAWHHHRVDGDENQAWRHHGSGSWVGRGTQPGLGPTGYCRRGERIESHVSGNLVERTRHRGSEGRVAELLLLG